jgi:drug/metabolite transporter (DMT)-like permease
MSVRTGAGGNWLAQALASLAFFAITNFLLGYIAERSAGDPGASVKAAMILWLGCGLLGAGGVAWFALSGRRFWGPLGKKALRFPVVAGISLALGMLLLKGSLAADPLAKGPMVAVTSSNALVVALLALAFIGERLSRGQWAGFTVIVVGIALISLGGGGRAGLGALGLAAAAMLLFGTTNFLLKLAGRSGCDSIAASVVLWLAVGACGILAVAGYRLLRGGYPFLAQPALGWLALLAGGSLALGMLAIKRAVTLGQAGPAAAVSGSNSILVCLLDLALLGHWPPPLKLAGMLTAVAGIAMLAVARPLRMAGGPARGGSR